MHYQHIWCLIWCIRYRVCFMLELGLHSRNPMYWVSSLRFSIPYLIEWLSCCSSLFLCPFQVRPTDMSDCYRIGALEVLFLSFSDFQFLCFYHYFRDLLCYLDSWLFIEFIECGDDSWRLINGDFRIIIYYFIFENTGVTIWYHSGVPSPLWPRKAIYGTRISTIFNVSGLGNFWKKNDTLLSSIFRLVVSVFNSYICSRRPSFDSFLLFVFLSRVIQSFVDVEVILGFLLGIRDEFHLSVGEL